MIQFGSASMLHHIYEKRWICRDNGTNSVFGTIELFLPLLVCQIIPTTYLYYCIWFVNYEKLRHSYKSHSTYGIVQNYVFHFVWLIQYSYQILQQQGMLVSFKIYCHSIYVIFTSLTTDSESVSNQGCQAQNSIFLISCARNA